MSKRLSREKRTVYLMIKMYCHQHHQAESKLCVECNNLWEYSLIRIDKCVYGIEKPPCSNCPVHCYNSEMRNRIREVMRYAGPVMILKHPYYAIMHIVDKILYAATSSVKKTL